MKLNLDIRSKAVAAGDGIDYREVDAVLARP
jgi:hypothetical protein